MKSVLAVSFIAVNHICDMCTVSVLCLVTKHGNGTHLALRAATSTRQSLSLILVCPKELMNKLLINTHYINQFNKFITKHKSRND